jgi:hypothetical protein
MEFEVVLWLVTPCSVVVGYRRFNHVTRRHNLEELDLKHHSCDNFKNRISSAYIFRVEV